MKKNNIDMLLEDCVKKAVDIVLERSINAKERDIDNVFDFFNKSKSGANAIKTFGILSAENSDSTTESGSKNKKNTKSLKDLLRNNRTPAIPQVGIWGIDDKNKMKERSYFLINVTPSLLSYCAGKYQQTSFIYGYIKDGKLYSEYWEKRDKDAPYDEKINPYIVKDSVEGYKKRVGADTNLSIIGNKFKYSFPFSIFESCENKILSNLKCLNEDVHGGAYRIATKGCGQNAYNYKGAIYRGLLE